MVFTDVFFINQWALVNRLNPDVEIMDYAVVGSDSEHGSSLVCEN